MKVFSPAQFRAQFPALRDAGVYLDSAATALKPQPVIEASQQFYSLTRVMCIAASSPRPGASPNVTKPLVAASQA